MRKLEPRAITIAKADQRRRIVADLMNFPAPFAERLSVLVSAGKENRVM